MDPVGLVQLRGVFRCVFGVEVVVGGGNKRFVVDLGLLERRLSWERVFSGLDFVYISIILLLFGTHLFVMFLELLGWSETWEKWKVRSHVYITYLKYILS